VGGGGGPLLPAAAGAELDRLVWQAQQGDRAAREALLRRFRPFVMRAAAAVSGRFVRPGRDDEASVALMAFNEAISAYRRQRGGSFLAFAEMVIRRRLIDHLRKSAARRAEIPVSDLAERAGGEEAGEWLAQMEAADAQRRFEEEMLARERREEIGRLSCLLQRFGIRFSDLVRLSPRHRDARERAVEVARLIAQHPQLRRQLLERGCLPLKELQQVASVSRKTLERQRKYIIAVALILCGDFPHLREYLEGSGGGPQPQQVGFAGTAGGGRACPSAG